MSLFKSRTDFNPRSPCGERHELVQIGDRYYVFQSALPLRGATARRQKAHRDNVFQSALPLRGATYSQAMNQTALNISIRAPLAGSDLAQRRRGARAVRISIRAPLAGSDAKCQLRTLWTLHFNPRSPCGERRQAVGRRDGVWDISIRAPLAGSDGRAQHREPNRRISIRAPLAGSDLASPCGGRLKVHFNPRSPCGERQHVLSHGTVNAVISIRAPLAGSDVVNVNSADIAAIFQSALPLRGATAPRQL